MKNYFQYRDIKPNERIPDHHHNSMPKLITVMSHRDLGLEFFQIKKNYFIESTVKHGCDKKDVKQFILYHGLISDEFEIFKAQFENKNYENPFKNFE
jgi:hypothetical protein